MAVATESLSTFASHFQTAYVCGLQRRPGVATGRAEDIEPAQDLLTLRAENGADFTLAFRRPCDAVIGPKRRRSFARSVCKWQHLRSLARRIA